MVENNRAEGEKVTRKTTEGRSIGVGTTRGWWTAVACRQQCAAGWDNLAQAKAGAQYAVEWTGAVPPALAALLPGAVAGLDCWGLRDLLAGRIPRGMSAGMPYLGPDETAMLVASACQAAATAQPAEWARLVAQRDEDRAADAADDARLAAEKAARDAAIAADVERGRTVLAAVRDDGGNRDWDSQRRAAVYALGLMREAEAIVLRGLENDGDGAAVADVQGGEYSKVD
jgi:hypothetical protein